jgi:hypothetical protein
MSNAFAGLVPYYTEFVPQHFVKADGKPVGKRSAQIFARRYRLPLVRVGSITFIDVEKAADRLREQLEPPRRGPGRPRAA